MSEGPRVDVERVPMTPAAGALEAAQRAQVAAGETRELAAELLAATRAAETPATWTRIALTATNPVQVWDERNGFAGPTMSIGLLNPGPLPVYIGLGGGTAELLNGAPSVPPKGLLVLPIQLGQVELGIDPADQGALVNGDVFVYGLRFASVQPAFLGRGV
jgi:hypothetical protein